MLVNRGVTIQCRVLKIGPCGHLSSEGDQGLDEDGRLGVDVGAADDLRALQRLVILGSILRISWSRKLHHLHVKWHFIQEFGASFSVSVE